jgi:chromosome segregation ATPase
MLDEVDAPLDDANVGRFCELVRSMSEQVQFIFISHNKVTMEIADHLLGVTMHEPGVSRLVSRGCGRGGASGWPCPEDASRAIQPERALLYL